MGREVCTSFECPNENEEGGPSSQHGAAQNFVTAALVCPTSSPVRIPLSLMRKRRFATGVTTCVTSALTAVAALNLTTIYCSRMLNDDRQMLNNTHATVFHINVE